MKIARPFFAGLWLLTTSACLGADWKLLFDGKTLDGWEAQTTANWRVENGAIVADHGREGLLVTKQSYSDYEVQVVFRAKEDTLSGIYLSCPKTVTDPGSEAYELAIAPESDAYPTGSLGGRIKVSGGEYKEWRTYRAKIQGADVQVWLDGKLVVEYKDKRPIKSGRIGLQFDRGRVEFKSIQVKDQGLP